MTDALKQAIADSELPHLTIEQDTGISRGSIMRFMRGEQSLRLDLADTLAEYFGIEVKAPKRKE